MPNRPAILYQLQWSLNFLLQDCLLFSTTLQGRYRRHRSQLSLPSSRMEDKEEVHLSSLRKDLYPLFSEFLVRVVKLEELVTASRNFLISFQQELSFLRRPPIDNTSVLIKDIIEKNETKRLKSYIKGGCINSHDCVKSMSNVTSCVRGLEDHISLVKGILEELECLMDDAGRAIQAADKSASVETEMDFGVGLQQEEHVSCLEESVSEKLDPRDYASLMAIIYHMVKQDYVMQGKIVSSLSLKTPANELDTYCLMWSIRPFVDDDVIHQALRHVS